MSCWGAVSGMLQDGASPAFVARVVQEEYGEYLDVSQESLERQIYRWLSTEGRIPKNVLSQSTIEEMINQIFDSEDIDFLKELVELVRYQRARLELASDAERSMSFPMDAQTKEVKTYFEMLEKGIRILQDIGILPKRPAALAIDAHLTTSGSVQEAAKQIEELDAESKRALRGQFRVIEEHAIEGERYSILNAPATTGTEES